MEFPFFADKDSTRYCYLRLRVLEELLKRDVVLDALVDQLEVPGKPAVLRRMNTNEKVDAIDSQISHYRRTKTSLWYGTDALEVLAASIYRAGRLSDKLVLAAFGDVKREADLTKPIAKWLRAQGREPFTEVPLATKRIDLLGYRKGGIITSESIVGVELKNELVQIERGLDQMTTFSEFCNRTYLACTPALAAEYLRETRISAQRKALGR